MRHASHSEREKLCDEAASLIALLHEDSSIQNRLALASFLKRSPEHVRAFLAARSAILEISKSELIAHFAAQQRRLSLVAILSRVWGVLGFHWTRIFFAGVSVTIVVAVFCYVSSQLGYNVQAPRVFDKDGTYRIGNSSEMTLHRGSQAELRSFDSGRGQEVTLVKGAAIFSGEHSQANPLRVAAYPVVIEMTGTLFEVKHPTAFSTDIDVSSGDVVLRSHCPLYRSLFKRLLRRTMSPLLRGGLHLSKGQFASVSGDPCDPHVEFRSAAPAEEADTGEVLLEFRDTPVREAVQMFNSRSATQTIIVDDVVGRQRIRGEFLSSRVDSFVGALQKKYNAIAERKKGAGGDLIYLRSREPVPLRQ
jgi:ferric-dicitrate binding protein FerR (iron transport regulator)